MRNTQPPETRACRNDGRLEVFKIFDTIQGEGPFVGLPATFIRLAGCNLQCPGCDTDYTSTRGAATVSAIVNRVAWGHETEGRPRLVVITGGEPFRQDISDLVRSLLYVGHRVQIETNGTLPAPPDFPSEATIVCSPKAGKVNLPWERIDALKYVLSHDAVDPDDGLPTKVLDHPVNTRVARPPKAWHGEIYLQPADAGNIRAPTNRLNREAVIRSCMRYGYRLCLQTHKYLNLE